MKKPIILDGGMGRELKRIGAPFSQPLWSAQALIEAPNYVSQAHQGFIDAGAEIITANSYACVPFHLGETRYRQQGADLAQQAARIAREMANKSKKKVLVAGSLPPAFGSYRPDLFESERAHDILSTLFTAQDEHVDLWIAETISSIKEAQAIIHLLKDSTKPCYYAFTLSDDVETSASLRSGESVFNAIEAIITENVDGILFNCSIPEVIEHALRETKKVLVQHNKKIPIGAFANSFTPIPMDHQANLSVQDYRYLSPQEYVEFAKIWHQLGASIIGGCCGIGPDHIEALVRWRNGLEDG
ncbi:homocysteine S-methyltransferase family protein [Marinomonas sp. 15G1-11]|uniref:Homocysteine S-methyltransferase family protein n=1 Tax=Marinomonas phaeophyticola TaxID=3004091 RepID=A0ABT4JR16_9GAMM|nr:homocysteine S-methyltransferase family protein [Marinomonas sp. 15G1-11]MCZ2720802.1 homocysteine S-methyltransferase family protein [Marinomonas sp. 15G1-11]